MIAETPKLPPAMSATGGPRSASAKVMAGRARELRVRMSMMSASTAKAKVTTTAPPVAAIQAERAVAVLPEMRILFSEPKKDMPKKAHPVQTATKVAAFPFVTAAWLVWGLLAS